MLARITANTAAIGSHGIAAGVQHWHSTLSIKVGPLVRGPSRSGGHTMLLQPRMMDTKAEACPAALTGEMSAYVSSRLSCTFMAWVWESPESCILALSAPLGYVLRLAKLPA